MGKFILNGICSTRDEEYANRLDIEELEINSEKDCFKYIGQRSFFRCTQIKSVNLSAAKSLENIGTGAFAFCSSLKNLILPKSLYLIGQEAFLECVSLEEIVLPNESQLYHFGEKCFMSCISLRSLYIPPRVTEICVFAFSLTSSLVSIKSDSPNFIVINDVLYTEDMKTLMQYPAACKNTSFVIPESVITISHYAFANSRFKTITFNTEIQNIYDNSFSNTSIKRAVISTNSCLLIGNRAFESAEQLEFVNLRGCGEVSIICEESFAFCHKLKEIRLPKKIKSIGGRCFKDCFSLKNFNVNDNCQLESIYNEAFMGSGLKNFHISEKLTFIGTSAFMESLISNITVSPKNQYYIFEDNTLYGESGRSITLFIGWKQKIFKPMKKVVLLRACCLYGATSLEEIILPDSVEIIMNDAISHTSVKKIVIPSSVKQLGERCLAFNRFLEYVEISQKIIPKNCLEGCIKLRYLNINGVQLIRGDAFRDCDKIECVYANPKLWSQLKKFFPSRVFSNKVCSVHDNPITIV